jgi:hypothetical protein
MDIITLVAVASGIIGAVAGIVTVVDYLQKRKEKRVSIPKPPQQQISMLSKFESQIIANFNLPRERVIVRVHSKYEPHPSAEIMVLFDELNEKRQSRRLDRYFAGRRFRPIRPPTIKDDSVEIDVTPLNYTPLLP